MGCLTGAGGEETGGSIRKGNPGRMMAVSRQFPGRMLQMLQTLACVTAATSLELFLGETQSRPVLSTRWNDEGPGGRRARASLFSPVGLDNIAAPGPPQIPL